MDCGPGFDMPVRIYIGGAVRWIHPVAGWRTVIMAPSKDVYVDPNFLVDVVTVSADPK